MNQANDEKYFDIAEEWHEENPLPGEAKGGGGGKQGRKTRKAKKEKQIKNSIENRKEEIAGELKGVLKEFPKFEDSRTENSYWQQYISWVNACLQENRLVLDENNDLELKFSRSGKKAGGQNVNKVSSAVQCRHLVSNISVRNEETRSQRRNRKKAVELIKQRLKDHIINWAEYLDEKKELNKDTLMSLLV